jgi:hypothetical protein
LLYYCSNSGNIQEFLAIEIDLRIGEKKVGEQGGADGGSGALGSGRALSIAAGAVGDRKE